MFDGDGSEAEAGRKSGVQAGRAMFTTLSPVLPLYHNFLVYTRPHFPSLACTSENCCSVTKGYRTV